DLLPEAAAPEVAACVGAGLRLPEVAFVERGSGVEYRVETVAAPAPGVLLGGGFLVVQRDVEALSEPLDSTHEVDAFGLLDERDRVAGGAAAEAIVEPLLRADGERWRPLVVERAKPREPRTRAAKLRPSRNDLDDVRGSLDGLDRRVGDASHW